MLSLAMTVLLSTSSDGTREDCWRLPTDAGVMQCCDGETEVMGGPYLVRVCAMPLETKNKGKWRKPKTAECELPDGGWSLCKNPK